MIVFCDTASRRSWKIDSKAKPARQRPEAKKIKKHSL